MRKFFAVMFLAGLLVAQNAPKKTATAAKSKIAKPATTVVTPDQIQWGDAPAVFPPVAKMAVISGEFHVGMGDKWQDAGMAALPAGSFGSVPAHHNHYAVAKGETVVQVSSMGPFKLVYVNPADDPSKKK